MYETKTLNFYREIGSENCLWVFHFMKNLFENYAGFSVIVVTFFFPLKQIILTLYIISLNFNYFHFRFHWDFFFYFFLLGSLLNKNMITFANFILFMLAIEHKIFSSNFSFYIILIFLTEDNTENYYWRHQKIYEIKILILLFYFNCRIFIFLL